MALDLVHNPSTTMTDSQSNEPSQLMSENTKISTPPRRTPSPEATETELKLSRKREREVSLEPVTTPSGNDTDPLIRERKDSRIPLKKNRRRLDPTEEEEDGVGSGSRSGSGSPPTPTALASPRQEMKNKVRQISRGVEDITWKGVDSSGIDKNEGIDIELAPPLSPPAALGKEINQAEEKPDNAMADDYGAPPDKNEDVDIEPVPPLAPSTPPRNETDQTKEESSANGVDNTMADYGTPPKTPENSGLSHPIHELQAVDAAMILASPLTPNRLRASSDSNEKGLKRKYLERGTSHGPPEGGEASIPPKEPLKRPRDGSEKDDNPREAKRPSPPPSPPRPSPPSPKIPKSSGFMAYASTNSPFSSVKGRNIFGSTKSASCTASFGSPAPSAPATGSSSIFGQSSSVTTPTLVKRTGFEAFSGSSSPFASVSRMKAPVLGSTSKLGRAKSPPRRTNSALSSTFASYAGASQGFALPAQKKARAGSPDGSSRSSLERTPSLGVFGESSNGSESGGDDEQEDCPMSFGARLRAGKDRDGETKSDDEKVKLTEQDVMTGEEEEETLHQVRGKLFSLDDSQWKERGTGLLRLNVKQEDGTGARLVMRKDAVYTLLLNVTLFPGMRCSLSQDPRYLRFSAIEDGVATTYNLKVSNAKIASDLLDEINANIPPS